MKRILLFTVAALMITTSLAAQENGDGRRQHRERPDEATMIKMRTERMAQQLGLDETQTAKLLELNQKYPNAMMGGPGGPGGPGMRRPAREPRNDQNVTDDNTGGKKAKKAKKAKRAEGDDNGNVKNAREDSMNEMKATMEAYENELKGILTEEQFKTWQENRNRRPEGRGPGGPGGPGGRPGGPGRGGFGQGGNFGGGFGGGDDF